MVELSEAQPSPARSPSSRLSLRHDLLAFSLALLGGALGIVGAFVQELRSGGLLLLPFVGAPIIEELLKPAGVYVLLVRWPYTLRGRLYTASLAAISGLSFGIIEAVVYVTVYVSDAPASFVLYRFTLPLLLHTTTSFIFGLGINQRVLDWASRGLPLPKASRNLFIVAVALHALFNTVATVLWLSGILNVD